MPSPSPRETTLSHRLDAALSDCVVIDCEATGLDADTDRIVEIAALRLVDGRPVDHFHALVDPGRSLPRVVAELTGLGDADLRGAGPVGDVLEEAVRFTAGSTVVGHNVGFDIAFVNAEIRRSGRGTPLDPATALCTADTARQLIPREQVGRYRLSSLAEALGLPHPPSHRAADDVLATADLLVRLDALAHHLNL